MADKSSETVMSSAGRNLSENIFITSLALTLELAVIYLFTTILLFSGLYHQVWAIQIVGLLALIHLIAVPISYCGVRYDKRTLILIGLLMMCIWFILLIVYIVVFITYKFEGNDFKYRSLHHIVLFYYSLLDFVIVVMLSINIINENKRHTMIGPNGSPNASPTATPAAPPTVPTTAPPTGTQTGTPTANISEKRTLKSDKSLKNK